MNSKRLYFILLAIIGLLFIGLLAGAYGTNSLLTTRANKLTGLKAQNLAIAQQQIALKKAEKDVQQYSSLAAIAKVIVPQDKNQAEAVREIVNIASTNNITLESITFPTSSLGATLAAPSGAGATTAPAVTPSSSAGANLTQLTPVKSIPGVYELPITIVVDNHNPVLYDQLINFLSALEHNRRTSQVSSISISPTINPTYLTFTLTLNEYIKP